MDEFRAATAASVIVDCDDVSVMVVLRIAERIAARKSVGEVHVNMRSGSKGWDLRQRLTQIPIR